MRNKTVLSCLLLTATVFAFRVQAIGEENRNSAPQNAKQVNLAGQRMISIKLYERANAANKQKILANPTIVAIPGKPFSFVSGGEVKQDGVDELLEFGTRVNGKIGDAKDGSIPVSLQLSIGNLIETDDPTIQIVRSQSIDLRANLRTNTTKSVQIAENVWCDVQIE